MPGKVPWTEEPGGLQSRGSQRVGHFTFTSLYVYIYYMCIIHMQMCISMCILICVCICLYMCIFVYVYQCAYVRCCHCLVTKRCLTLCNPMDCSLPGSPVHRISQARILKWVATAFSGGSSQPRDHTCSSCHSSGIGDRFLTAGPLRKPV